MIQIISTQRYHITDHRTMAPNFEQMAPLVGDIEAGSAHLQQQRMQR